MPSQEIDINRNLERVAQRIADAAARAGRKPEAVKLIAVSKTKPWQMVARAIAHGQRDFGENTVQDALSKIPHTQHQPDVHWHFIGHLQSNKTRHIPANFQWLHTLESEKIARRLESHCAERRVSLNALVQVNIADDPGKSGLRVDEVPPFIERFLEQDFRFLKPRGLMTIGALESDEATRRKWFSGLRALGEAIATRFALPDFDQLSMGMSDDFEEAIEEGATMIRLGSTIFGHREYPVT
jgi:pyridoxal phosphate enzyme (YggS family)